MTLAQIQTLAWKNWSGFGGVLITLDDEYGGQWDGILYMKSKGIVGTEYVRTDNVNQPDYLTDAQLSTMDADGWCIANHTRNHTVFTTISEAEQEAQIQGGIDDLTAWGLIRNAFHLAYPSGAWNADSLTALANTGCLTGRGAAGGASDILATTDPLIVYPYVINIAHFIQAADSVADIQAVVNVGVTRGKYVMLGLHNLYDADPAAGSWLKSSFYSLIDWLVAQGIPCLTMDQFYALIP